MDEAKIDEIVDRVTESIESLQPVPAPPAGFFDTLSFAPVVTLAIGLVAAVIAVATLWQKSRSDARSEWWRRTQWAVDAWLSEDPERRAQGKLMFKVLTESKRAWKDEAKFLNVSKEQLDRRVAAAPDPNSAEPLPTRAEMEAAIRESNPNLDPALLDKLVNEEMKKLDMDEIRADGDNEDTKEVQG